MKLQAIRMIQCFLDKAVDKCYRKELFQCERERIEYLFGLYEKYTSGLLAVEGKKKGRG